MAFLKQSLPLLFCFVVNAVHQAPDARPNLTEWKEGQANASEAVAANVAKEAKMAAVNKVVTLLTDLRTQVLAEGETEAGTYNKESVFFSNRLPPWLSLPLPVRP